MVLGRNSVRPFTETNSLSKTSSNGADRIGSRIISNDYVPLALSVCIARGQTSETGRKDPCRATIIGVAQVDIATRSHR
jgi:hypothetical protein